MCLTGVWVTSLGGHCTLHLGASLSLGRHTPPAPLRMNRESPYFYDKSPDTRAKGLWTCCAIILCVCVSERARDAGRFYTTRWRQQQGPGKEDAEPIQGAVSAGSGDWSHQVTVHPAQLAVSRPLSALGTLWGQGVGRGSHALECLWHASPLTSASAYTVPLGPQQLLAGHSCGCITGGGAEARKI